MDKIASCASLDDVRLQIDRLDHQLLALIGERAAYVRQAARFKKSPDAVAAPRRVEQVIAKVKALAPESGVDPAIAEVIWRAMIAAFIEAEQVEYTALHSPSRP